jgi:hypothetical protein
MDKKTKMLLGVGAVAVVGYLVYRQMNKPKGFMNASGAVFAPQQSGKVFANLTAPDCAANPEMCPCPCGKVVGTANDGTTLCMRGHSCCKGKLGACPPKTIQSGF